MKLANQVPIVSRSAQNQMTDEMIAQIYLGKKRVKRAPPIIRHITTLVAVVLFSFCYVLWRNFDPTYALKHTIWLAALGLFLIVLGNTRYMADVGQKRVGGTQKSQAETLILFGWFLQVFIFFAYIGDSI